MHRLIRFASISCSRSVQRFAFSTSRSTKPSQTPDTHSAIHRKRRVQTWRMAKMSVRDVQRIIKTYQAGQYLRPTHFAQVSALLVRHPLNNTILKGRETPAAIRVVKHPAYQDGKNLCFAAVRFDKSECIFSYKLCLRGSHSSGIWYIFQQACRNELDHRGLIKQLKENNACFRKENPGFQLEFQFDRLVQDFSDRKQLLVSNEKQLLQLVGRNETLHWRILSQELARDFSDFATNSFNEPNSIYIKVEKTHEMRKVASLKLSEPTHQVSLTQQAPQSEEIAQLAETALNTDSVQETEQSLEIEQVKEVKTTMKTEQSSDTEQGKVAEITKQTEKSLDTEKVKEAETTTKPKQAQEDKYMQKNGNSHETKQVEKDQQPQDDEQEQMAGQSA